MKELPKVSQLTALPTEPLSPLNEGTLYQVAFPFDVRLQKFVLFPGAAVLPKTVASMNIDHVVVPPNEKDVLLLPL